MNDQEQLVEQVITVLRDEFGDDLLGVLATGSRVHGVPDATSDLDVHVVIASARRQRRNIVLAGVEIEMFINPPFQIRRYMAEGGNDRHMFTVGRVVYDPLGVIAELQAEAKALWDAGPPPVQAAWMPRYFTADLLRDIEDVAESDEATANLLIARAVDLLIETHCRLNRRWPEKPKRRLDSLARWDERAAQFARAALAGGSLGERRSALEQLAEHTLAPIGGPMPLEWRTEWEELRGAPSE
jgi:predicted nucleotidyltransferase